MDNQFFIYTDLFVNFTIAEKEIISSVLTHKKVKAKSELVSYDKRTDELFFLIKGCVRKYYVKDGEQLTIYIMTENNFIAAFDSFMTGSKSTETIECLEPCEVLIINKKDLENLYQKIPLMNEFIRKILEQTLIQFQQSLTSFIKDKPEERYEKLLRDNPAILQRVPQHMLATYLGITATSLSRIRKRILEK
ncbi:Crp/Fnr family transcriptional regulator [Chryseobacterium luquanense]|uniref:Crp/Fnr family transcriptional regulator n=1 Tax=Chryseobacterium luquanense TaxID=2983766 RepID=A0ABT3Y7L7_9FLAO|nr:Crp/Fnr family transcriptional regulator [Chryseobacterium luquanense]MCX8534164.1 Crp/Fnr family transcriptional regulator [Chryseobacterium luquanense]